VSEFTDSPSTGITALIVLGLALVSLILAVNYFFAIAKLYKMIRQKYLEKQLELRTRAESHQLSYNKIDKNNK
jgi:hypothetical protein